MPSSAILHGHHWELRSPTSTTKRPATSGSLKLNELDRRPVRSSSSHLATGGVGTAGRSISARSSSPSSSAGTFLKTPANRLFFPAELRPLPCLVNRREAGTRRRYLLC